MLSDDLLSFLWAHVLQFTIGITLVAVAIGLVGRRWPHFAFLLCMLALAKCLVPPLITSPAGIFTRYESVAFAPQLPDFNESDVVQWKQSSSGGERPNVMVERAVHLEADGARLPEGAANEVSGISLLPRRWLPSLIVFWCTGMLMILVHAWHQVHTLRRMVSAMQIAPQRIQQQCDEIQSQLGLRRSVLVVVSDQNYGPACVGYLHPRLILPQLLLERFPDRLLRPILVHEIVHARRGDIVWGYLQFMASVVWWFHPLVWWIGRRASDLCERCCDQEVVSSTRCKAGDYAESLVRVLELKSSLRAMPCYHAMAPVQMSPVQITRLRLEGIMKKCGRYSHSAAAANWSLVFLFGCLVIPGMHWAGAREIDSPATATPASEFQFSQTLVYEALRNGNWQQAIDALRPMVEQDPHSADAVFYLGYAIHAHGDYEQAIRYHQMASEFVGTRTFALYNWSCALALLGRPEEAVAKLREALDAGFIPSGDLADDPDFVSLSNNAEFQEIRQQQERFRQLDFWVGQWELKDSDGRLLSTHSVQFAEKGHLLMENWLRAGGGSGTSLTYMHSPSGTWRQTRIDDQGCVTELSGKLEGDQLLFNGTMCRKTGAVLACRMSLVPAANGAVEQIIERSDDGGQSWKIQLQGRLVREPGTEVRAQNWGRSRTNAVSTTGTKME
jgi:beta-lactamase regulating signal transducer with metallopeptidase domain